jgi:predicted dehydrogenase
VGIIGAGVMGQIFAPCLSAIAAAELASVADIDESRAQELATRYDIPYYREYEQMLEAEDVDAVLVLTPDRYHRDPCIAAAERGKHIFVEKPLATIVEEGKQIVESAKENNVVLMVGHCLRFDPRIASVEQAVRNGDLGELIHIHTRRNAYLHTGQKYAQSSTLAFFLSVHDADMVNWITGSRVVKVFSQGISKSLRVYEEYDSTFSILEFEDGTIACLENSWALPETVTQISPHALEVVGTEGMCLLQMGEQGMSVYTKSSTTFPDLITRSKLHDTIVGVYREEMIHFIDCVLNGKKPLVTGEDGLAAARVAIAIQESLVSGQEVRLV